MEEWFLIAEEFPLLKLRVILNNGSIGRAIAPSGASVGKNEALEKRDNGKNF